MFQEKISCIAAALGITEKGENPDNNKHILNGIKHKKLMQQQQMMMTVNLLIYNTINPTTCSKKNTDFPHAPMLLKFRKMNRNLKSVICPEMN